MIDRNRVAGLLLAITFALQVLLGPLGYLGEVVSDDDRFVEVAGAVLDHPDIRQAVATRVTEAMFASIEADEVVADVLPGETRRFAIPLTRIASGQLSGAAFAILDTDIAVEARESALRELHDQVAEGDETVTVDLRAVLVRTSRELAGPSVAVGVAQVVSAQEFGRITVAESGSSEAETIAALRALPAASGLATLLWLITLLAAIAIGTDRRRMLVIGGLVIAAGTLAATMAVVVVLRVVVQGFGSSPLRHGVADALASDFIANQWGAMAVGLALAAIGMMLGDRPAAVGLRQLPRHLWMRNTDGLRRSVSAIAGDNPAIAAFLLWAAAAVVLAGWPAPTLRVVLTVIILTLAGRLVVWLVAAPGPRASAWRQRAAFSEPIDAVIAATGGLTLWRVNIAALIGVVFLLWPAWDVELLVTFFVVLALIQAGLELGAARRYAQAEAPSVPAAGGEAWAPRWRAVVAAGAVVAVFAFAAVIALGRDGAEAAVGCNGHAELCERRIDEVVFAGSHNSMSSTDLGWKLAMQTGDIVDQLDHGIRALLIDTHYWAANVGLDGGEDAAASVVIEGALSDTEPKPGTWLCHGYCALGATNLTAALTDVAIWLDAHPREVLLLIVQDEISTTDTVEAFERSGLIELVHRHEIGDPWPALGDLVERNERVLVYAENEGTAASWYQNAWAEAFTETPYDYSVRSEFSCRPNRGQPDNPLFLINHWVTPGIPVREAAAAINDAQALLGRVEECEAVVGRLPTVLAVDFAETGDLVEVVAQLNGVGP